MPEPATATADQQSTWATVTMMVAVAPTDLKSMFVNLTTLAPPRNPRKMNASQQIVRVPFHDDVIEAVQTEDGKILVHFKRVCESLGVRHEAQLRKMKEREWCVFVDLSTPDQRGRPQQLTMIDLDSLPMWLATINPLNVRQETKAKLIRSQLTSNRCS
jgi:hypothetical protein